LAPGGGWFVSLIVTAKGKAEMSLPCSVKVLGWRR
jgi:hypothetical protein